MRLRYSKLAPDGYQALANLGRYLSHDTALEPRLLEMVYLRASQLNGSQYCIGLHTEELLKLGETVTRIDAVTDWRGADEFTARERAALSWAEAVTDVNSSHVSDEDYAAVKEFFEDKDLADLTLAIAVINAWNRIGVAFRVAWPERVQDASRAMTAFSVSAGDTVEAGAESEINEDPEVE
ncbi:MAG: carboxymuconolactone decarboxylase family protein [Acidobacteriaceae bacterium]